VLWLRNPVRLNFGDESDDALIKLVYHFILRTQVCCVSAPALMFGSIASSAFLLLNHCTEFIQCAFLCPVDEAEQRISHSTLCYLGRTWAYQLRPAMFPTSPISFMQLYKPITRWGSS